MTCHRDDHDVEGRLVVCVRGTVGCGLEHGPWPEVARASGVAACASTSLEPGDEFDGALL